jgi:EAL domain-containing protein (putative c-di-GMP-specific phosphodiesterase class I)
MSFLAPIFLWLLPFTAIPLLLHLLNKRNIINIDFSTLIFLKKIESESIKRLNLLQLLLLILRTIIILLIILMISRPIIKNSFTSNGESIYTVILVDDSFSSTSNIDYLKKTSFNILKSIKNKSHILWINSNSGIKFDGLKEDLPNIENLLSKTYLDSPLTNSIKIIKSQTKNILFTKELFILTDNKLVNIEEINKINQELNNFNIYTATHPQLKNNISITNVEIINEVFTPNDKILIEIDIENFGVNDVNNKSLNLDVDDITVGQQLVSIKKGSKKKYLFTTIITRYGETNCSVQLEIDEDIDDNIYYFTINIPKKQNVAIISEIEQQSFYIEESINALNKLNKAFQTNRYKKLNDSGFSINMYDIIFLLNSSFLNNIKDSRVEEYVFNGGHLILLPSLNQNKHLYENINYLSTEIEDNYKNISIIDIKDNAYQKLNYKTNTNELSRIFNPKERNINSNILLYKYLDLPFNNKNTKLIDDNNRSIWNRYIIGNGILDIFGLSFDLKSSSLPISGSYIPFINFLLYSNSSINKKIFKYTNEKWMYKSDSFYENLYHIKPNGEKIIINDLNNKYFSTGELTYPGFHEIYSDKNKLSSISVNIDKREFQNNYSSIEKIKNKLKKSIIHLDNQNNNIIEEINKARKGHELWRYIIYLISILIIIEMLISNAYQAKK